LFLPLQQKQRDVLSLNFYNECNVHVLMAVPEMERPSALYELYAKQKRVCQNTHLDTALKVRQNG
ncbi:MAG: hypothetical protein SPI56_02870, partial [Alloprevotella sp.]|nr:hypothetical protein [Alloprevotella sp.]